MWKNLQVKNQGYGHIHVYFVYTQDFPLQSIELKLVWRSIEL